MGRQQQNKNSCHYLNKYSSHYEIWVQFIRGYWCWLGGRHSLCFGVSWYLATCSIYRKMDLVTLFVISAYFVKFLLLKEKKVLFLLKSFYIFGNNYTVSMYYRNSYINILIATLLQLWSVSVWHLQWLKLPLDNIAYLYP